MNANAAADGLLGRVLRSPAARLLGLGVLALALQVAVLFIGDLVRERQGTRDAAVAEMAAAWGGAQRLAGPFLLVPYRTPAERDGARQGEAAATFLPAELRVTAALQTERLRRGLFQAPVYRSIVELSGRFEPPDFRQWAVAADQVLGDRAELVFEVSDVRTIQAGARLRWEDGELEWRPGTGLRAGDRPGIHARLPQLAASAPAEGAPADGGAWTFRATLELAGSAGLRLAPTAEATAAEIIGDWPDPSFQGAWLPAARELRDGGFSASWSISHLGRGFPQSWRADAYGEQIDAAMVGVDLLTPVDPYRQAERSLKYSLLFLALTFGTAWLFEVLGGARLHPIHYALIGAAMCLFYLLELALSEHLGFPAAYAIAAALVVVTNGAYARSLLSGGRAALLAGVLAVLYAGMYALLQLDDYALLAGAGALFLILAAVMYATRRVNWHAADFIRPSDATKIPDK